jgi:hypothetical protein
VRHCTIWCAQALGSIQLPTGKKGQGGRGMKRLIKGVFSSHFTQNILGFGPSFCKIELNTMQAKKSKSSHPFHKKFGILDVTKHTHKNFGILHFIIQSN